MRVVAPPAQVTIGGGDCVSVDQTLRALMDLVALRKTDWQGLGWIEDGLRIERANLETLRKSDFTSLRPVYKHKRVRRFLNELETEVLSMKSVRTRRKETSND